LEDHFIYVRGYPEAIPISAQEKEQVRKGMVGEQALADLSLIIQNKTLLIRVADIAVLESRPKPLCTRCPYFWAPDEPLFRESVGLLFDPRKLTTLRERL